MYSHWGFKVFYITYNRGNSFSEDLFQNLIKCHSLNCLKVNVIIYLT